MNSIYSQMGFTDPTQFLAGMVSGEDIQKFAWDSIPGFVYGQAASTLVWGIYSRRQARKEAEARIEHMKEMEQIQSMMSHERNQAEIDMMHDSFRQGITFQREYSKRLMDSRKLQSEFEYYCENTWAPRFKPAIVDIFNKHSDPVLNSSGGIRINLLLSRTKDLQSLVPSWGIDLRSNYLNFSEDFIDFIGKHEHFNTMWLRMWEKPSLGIVADSMNVFYLMQGLPTIILFLKEKENKLSVDATMWGFQVGHSNMITSNILEARFTDSHKEEIAMQLLLAATSFLCDSFNESLQQFDSRLFPKIQSSITSNEIKDKIQLEYHKLDELKDMPLMSNLKKES